MINIKSAYATMHDSSFGGYPVKVVVTVEMDAKRYAKECPIVRRKSASMFGPAKSVRDLSKLVGYVNFKLSEDFSDKFNAYNPSIDSRGETRSKGGIKTMTFEYFVNRREHIEALGFQVVEFANGNGWTTLGFNKYISLIG